MHEMFNSLGSSSSLHNVSFSPVVQSQPSLNQNISWGTRDDWKNGMVASGQWLSAGGQAVTSTNASLSTAAVTGQAGGVKIGDSLGEDAEKSGSVAEGSSRSTFKKKNRTPEEEEITKETAARFATLLAADHISVLYPDVDSPFVGVADVINRLLPYHVYQQPKEDLDAITRVDLDFYMSKAGAKGKGKERARDDVKINDLRREIAETKFALQCLKRHKGLQERFRRIRSKGGTRNNPSPQAYILAQAMVDAERVESTSLSSELRAARTELDKIQREKRVAGVAAGPSWSTSVSGSSSAFMAAANTPAFSTTSYSFAAPIMVGPSGGPGAAASTGATAGRQTSYYPQTQYSQAGYYRAYPYGYTQTYPTGTHTQAYAAAAAAAAAGGGTNGAPPGAGYSSIFSSAPSANGAVHSSIEYSVSSHAPTTMPQATLSANTYSPTPTGPIPVQLPVSALPALAALGIMPVPAQSPSVAVSSGHSSASQSQDGSLSQSNTQGWTLQPAEASQPSQASSSISSAPQSSRASAPPIAILRGATSNGQMLSLEINVGMLGAAQMAGLAVLLGRLMAGGVRNSPERSIGTATTQAAADSTGTNVMEPATQSSPPAPASTAVVDPALLSDHEATSNVHGSGVKQNASSGGNLKADVMEVDPSPS